MTPESIITDEEVERVHANANFGTMTKRDVVAFALLKAACGYHSGGTARSIIIEHGLTSNPSNPMNVPTLRKKGREYLWACFGSTDI